MLNRSQVIEVAQQIAEKYPDQDMDQIDKAEGFSDWKEMGWMQYSYTRPDGAARCIVGRIIEKLEPDTLRHLHHSEIMSGGSDRLIDLVTSTSVGIFDRVVAGIFPKDDPGLIHALQQGQAWQDEGSTLGTAAMQIIEALKGDAP